MTRYFRYDGTASQYRMRDAFSAEPGDVVEVDDDTADALADHDDFTEVDESEAESDDAEAEAEAEAGIRGEETETSPMAGTQPEEEGEPEPGTQAASDSEAEEPDEGDFTQDDGTLDITAWRTPGYRERVELVESGEMDDHLDEIAEVDTSDNVLDAVAERQDDTTGR